MSSPRAAFILFTLSAALLLAGGFAAAQGNGLPGADIGDAAADLFRESASAVQELVTRVDGLADDISDTLEGALELELLGRIMDDIDDVDGIVDDVIGTVVKVLLRNNTGAIPEVEQLIRRTLEKLHPILRSLLIDSIVREIVPQVHEVVKTVTGDVRTIVHGGPFEGLIPQTKRIVADLTTALQEMVNALTGNLTDDVVVDAGKVVNSALTVIQSLVAGGNISFDEVLEKVEELLEEVVETLQRLTGAVPAGALDEALKNLLRTVTDILGEDDAVVKKLSDTIDGLLDDVTGGGIGIGGIGGGIPVVGDLLSGGGIPVVGNLPVVGGIVGGVKKQVGGLLGTIGGIGK